MKDWEIKKISPENIEDIYKKYNLKDLVIPLDDLRIIKIDILNYVLLELEDGPKPKKYVRDIIEIYYKEAIVRHPDEFARRYGNMEEFSNMILEGMEKAGSIVLYDGKYYTDIQLPSSP